MPKPSPASRTNDAPDAKPVLQATAAVRLPKIASVTPSGPRKLIRPTVPAMTRANGRNLRRPPALTAQEVRGSMVNLVHDPSHAEMFYLRKQAQDQTLMVFVLEDGEQIEGYIEWYDRHAIKVRNGARTLIYKSSIKYLYKAVEKPRR